MVHCCPWALPLLLLFCSQTLTSLALASPNYYPPKPSTSYSLTHALTGHGAPGIFDSSTTPDGDYGVYNWCNMPHARKREYIPPSREFKLEYVEVIQRHHKRTPYGSNTFFKEDVQWNCDNAGPVYGGQTKRGIGLVQWQAYADPSNPWSTSVGPGFIDSTCQFPQITPEGLDDSLTHGADLRSVYAPLLQLPPIYDPSIFRFRVTNNPITSQIASALFLGLLPASQPQGPIPVGIQPSSMDTLEPTYPCPRANALRSQYTTGDQGDEWRRHLTDPVTLALYDRLDKVSGIARQDSAGWHTSFDHYYDNLSAKQCHGKGLPCSVNDTSLCISQEDANTVYRLGNWEYAYTFRGAPLSASYAALRFGGFMLELKSHLQAKVSRTSTLKYTHNVAHDGSISALLGFLQVEEMVWPGMGAEIVFELYSKSTKSHEADHFVRVLWSGQPMLTSTPLGSGGLLDMVPLQDFVQYIDSMVGSGSELLATCTS